MNQFQELFAEKGGDCSKSTMSVSSCSHTSEEEYNRRVSSFKIHSSSINANAVTRQTIHSLEAELIRLRESTKDALQQSWEEVEALQGQCAAHLDITNQLENDIVEARRKEEYWHKRCLEAEFQLLQSNPQEQESSDNFNRKQTVQNHQNDNKAFQFNPLRMPFFKRDQDNDSIDGSLHTHPSKFSQEDYQYQSEKVLELESKLQDREVAIRSLEETVERHVKTMHSMQAEMQCMMETQRIKERKSQAMFRKQESFLESQLNEMQNELETKDELMASQKKRSEEYKQYIEDLATELELVMSMLQQSQTNRLSINVHVDSARQ